MGLKLRICALSFVAHHAIQLRQGGFGGWWNLAGFRLNANEILALCYTKYVQLAKRLWV
mgnify:CR=1 FL=1